MGVGGAGGFGFQEDQGGDYDNYDGHDEDSDGLIDGGFGNGAAQNLGLFAAQQSVEAQEGDHGRGGGLDTAAAATGVCADQHDNHEEEQGADAEAWDVDGVETCGSAGKGHEDAGFKFLPETQVREDVAPFAEDKEGDTDGNDNEGKADGDTAMERDFSKGSLLEVVHVLDFGNGQEAETAGQGQDAGGDVHDGIQLETDQGIGEQGEAYVTEGTDGLEDASENAVVEAVLHQGFFGKLGEVEDGADAFQDEGKGEDCLQDLLGVHVTFLGVVGQ